MNYPTLFIISTMYLPKYLTILLLIDTATSSGVTNSFKLVWGKD